MSAMPSMPFGAKETTSRTYLNYNHVRNASDSTHCQNSQLPKPAVSTIHSLHWD